MGPDNYADFVNAIHDPDVVRAMLEDYRAGLAVDRGHDEADRAVGRRLECPTLVAWSSRDDMSQLYGDPLDVWRPWAGDLRAATIDSGHHVAEENPDDLVTALLVHLNGI
jgi:haloacetate dehalogenase